MRLWREGMRRLAQLLRRLADRLEYSRNYNAMWDKNYWD